MLPFRRFTYRMVLLLSFSNFKKKMKVAYSTALLFIIALDVIAVYAEPDPYKHPEEKRQALVKEIIKKVTNLSLNAFLNTTAEERPQIMKKIREKLVMASKFDKSHGNRYVELIMDGIQSFVKNKKPDVNRSKHAKKTRGSNVRRVHRREYEQRAPETTKGNRSGSLELADEVIDNSDDDTVCDCNCVERELCSKIWSLGKFTCYAEQNKISIEKLCDGENNCEDNSDEENCSIHANNKVFEAKWLLKEIEKILPKRCLEVQISTDKVVVATKEKTLANVLKKQQTLLNTVLLNESGKPKELKMFFKKESNAIALVVSNVANAFEGAFCIREIYKNLFSRKDGTPLDDDLNVVEHKLRSWLPPLCTCDDQFCVGNNCTSACNNTCWQRYTFGRWGCLALSGAQSVSIDVICDGKIDCFDESDEEGCTTGVRADKFKAIQLYDDILQLLSTKTGSTDFSPQLSKLIDLQEAVRSLQKQTLLDETDASAVKLWRDEAFSRLHSIYESTLSNANDIVKVDAAYNLLISANNKLVDAMKRSKTGNEKLVPFNGCQCIGDKCLQVDCPVVCMRTCAVQDIIQKYSCKGNSDTKIPIRYICNGKVECPERDDEENCKPDVCRNHHLVLLRHNILNHKDEDWGNTLAEVIDSWKDKTNSTISTIEERYRTNRQDLQQVVVETLHDLVRVFASMPKLTRRKADIATAVFLDLSRLIQDILRECTN